MKERMDRIWKSIKQDVENRKWDTNGLQDLYTKQLDVILKKEPVKKNVYKEYSTISRNGDIVVGFYNEEYSNAKTLHLSIDGQTLPKLEINPGKFVYIFENTHVYPIISVVYSELNVTTQNYDGLYVVYALIKANDLRYELAHSKCVGRLRNGKIVAMRGIFGYDEYIDKIFQDEDYKVIELPDMRI